MPAGPEDAGARRRPGGLEVAVHGGPPDARVTLTGYLDLDTAPLLRAALRPLLAGTDPAPTVLDLDVAGLTFCDAAGLSPLIQALLALRERGGRVVLTRPGPALRRLLETLHLSADFGVGTGHR